MFEQASTGLSTFWSLQILCSSWKRSICTTLNMIFLRSLRPMAEEGLIICSSFLCMINGISSLYQTWTESLIRLKPRFVWNGIKFEDFSIRKTKWKRELSLRFQWPLTLENSTMMMMITTEGMRNSRISSGTFEKSKDTMCPCWIWMHLRVLVFGKSRLIELMLRTIEKISSVGTLSESRKCRLRNPCQMWCMKLSLQKPMIIARFVKIHLWTIFSTLILKNIRILRNWIKICLSK